MPFLFDLKYLPVLGGGREDIQFEYPLAEDLASFPSDTVTKLETIYIKADGCLRGLQLGFSGEIITPKF